MSSDTACHRSRTDRKHSQYWHETGSTQMPRISVLPACTSDSWSADRVEPYRRCNLAPRQTEVACSWPLKGSQQVTACERLVGL